MFSRFKIIIITILLIVGAWFSWHAYYYFFNNSEPYVTLVGIEEKESYTGQINCSIEGRHDYKVSDLSVWLDGRPLISCFKIGKGSFSHLCDINSHSLPNGSHILAIEANAGTFQKNKATIERAFYIDNTPLQAAFVSPEPLYKVFQGRTLHIQFQVNKPIAEGIISLLSKSYHCYPESKDSLIYECFVPIDCEENPSEYIFSIDIKDAVNNKLNLSGKFQVVSFPFEKQMISISSEKYKEEQQLGEDSKKLNERLKELSQKSPAEKLWRGAFVSPIDIVRTTCEFGCVRTTQQKGRYMHKAVDVINNPKSVVWAPADGIVIVKGRYVEGGNTVVVDHGCGVFSLLCHLENFANIEEGDMVKKGNPIGTLGKTGYATGYHLHWAIIIDNIPVDPMQWIKQNF